MAFRTGAVPDRERVKVLDEAATKTNAKETGAGAGVGLDLATALAVEVRVRRLDGPQHCWMDVHVFDGNDRVIWSETLPLQYLRADDGESDVYGFDADVYRGTGASPGSVWLAPDARRVQFRLYYEAGGTVFSDGLLRQHELAPDSSVTHSAAPVRRRRPPASSPTRTGFIQTG